MTKYQTEQAIADVEGLVGTLKILLSRLHSHIGMSEVQDLLLEKEGHEIRKLSAKYAMHLLNYGSVDDAEKTQILLIIGKTGDVHCFSTLYTLFSIEIDLEMQIKILNAIGEALSNTDDYMMLSMLKMNLEILSKMIESWPANNKELFVPGYAAKNKIQVKIKELAKQNDIS